VPTGEAVERTRIVLGKLEPADGGLLPEPGVHAIVFGDHDASGARRVLHHVPGEHFAVFTPATPRISAKRRVNGGSWSWIRYRQNVLLSRIP